MAKSKKFDSMVSVRIPAAVHDRLAQEAVRRAVDLSDVIRERLARPNVSQMPRLPRDGRIMTA
jgi:predicted HicB family RNase H-like nuclease